MGRRLLAETLAAPDCRLAGAVERPGHPMVGQPVSALLAPGTAGPAAGPGGGEPLPDGDQSAERTAALERPVGDDPVTLFATADAVLDFTTPASTREFASLAAQGKTVHIIGTTGLDAAGEAELAKAARHAPIVYAANMSLGVNLLLALARRVAAVLDEGWDAEIVEMHHRHKVDAPSGTALALGRAVAQGRRVALEDHWVKARDGTVGPRREGEIGFATLRGGDVVGEHRVLFAAAGEQVELVHRAGRRDLFAQGALRAARWAHGQPPGLYGMADVLGLEDMGG
jgi:4-hydroxy-tetrahydrodipicolinate reductase